MAKTRLTEAVKGTLVDYMLDQYDSKNKDVLKEQETKVVSIVNKIIRAKYPEEDMKILRKYDVVRKDACLRFINKNTQAVFGLSFTYKTVPKELADVPCNKNCETYLTNDSEQKLIEKHHNDIIDEKNKRGKKNQEYLSFLHACRYVEDVAEVVPFTDDMKQRYFSGGALVAFNPEKLLELKNEFKPTEG